ncbi:aspartate/glutamate racemase family protein [Aureimonas populi]|uniref:Aspartate/glutamate racemase family protein n=1 Tax=Aureimonas populi TaxID=1701758 RepID=A0ABW5CIZ2_9HYPH|nr:aspartate/glutamate racemase family protein [Aureimonas populi]
MRIAIVNPNASASMTAMVLNTARGLAAPGTHIEAATNEDGPLSIEGTVDGALAVPGMLARMKRAQEAGAHAHIIACFDDTGLDAARSLLEKPVIGIGEAGAKAASFLASRFTVVTTLSCSVPILEENLRRYGLADRATVRASEMAVLALEADPGQAEARISDEIEKAIAQDRAEAVVLGCAGMTALAAGLSRRHGLPVVDGVAAAVKFAEALCALGVGTARRGLYAPPRDAAAKRKDGEERR